MKEEGQRQLAALRLLGLFDRPASAGCLKALRAEPVIEGLTEPLVGLSDREWRTVLTRLSDISLLTVEPNGDVDAHPLLREYFGESLKDEGRMMKSDSSFLLLPSAQPTVVCTSTCARRRRINRSRRSTTCSRCTRPWPTGVWRGCSRKCFTRFITRESRNAT